MPQFAIPTPADQHRFLLRLYFGDEDDFLLSCVRRAYLDFCRTLRGFASANEAKALQNRGSSIVETFLLSLPEQIRLGADQPTYDELHRGICLRLCEAFAEGGFPEFYIGQAQKWLNMAIKYVFVFGEDSIPGFAAVYPLGHMPIDNIMLKRLRPLNPPQLSSSWSRLSDYTEYLGFQNWVRNKFKPSVPLAVEFHIWLDSVKEKMPEAKSGRNHHGQPRS